MPREPEPEAGDRSVSADEQLDTADEWSRRQQLIIPRPYFPFILLNQRFTAWNRPSTRFLSSVLRRLATVREFNERADFSPENEVL